MLKIILVGLKNCLNLGDVVINDSTEYLIHAIFREINFRNYTLVSIDMTEEDYSHIEGSDLIIFVGGGILKYKYQKFYYYIDKITRMAEMNNIPVIFNAVGVEDYDESNANCKLLQEAINRKCVKQITTRDDLELLQSKYLYNGNISCKVADPAVWTSDVFKVQKKVNTNLIGLGVIREGIFKSNGINVGFDELVILWKNVIDELESQNIKWEVFTTGWPSDMKFAINFMKAIGRECDILKHVRPEPKSAKELVNNISRYKSIIAGRLHANIIAYSLNIPAIGLVWNDKCRFWGENIGFPQRYFESNNLDGRLIVKECIDAMQNGYKEYTREPYKMSVYNSLKRYLINLVNN